MLVDDRGDALHGPQRCEARIGRVRPRPVCRPGLAKQAGKAGHVRPEGGRQVGGGGQQRLQHGTVQRRRLVVVAAAGHFRDGRGRGTTPGPQGLGDAVGGEQVPVVDQVHDRLGGRPAGRGAALAHDHVVAAGQVAPVVQVAFTAVGVEFGEAGDAVAGEPVQQPGQLRQPPGHAEQVQRGPVGAWQLRDRLVAGCEHGHNLFLGDQPPPGIGDRGEVEAAQSQAHLHRQAGHLREVPPIVLEHRAPGSLREGEAGLPADIGAGERRAGWVREGERGGHSHWVVSSGRNGSSSSRPVTCRLAWASTAGSKRSSTWPIRWE